MSERTNEQIQSADLATAREPILNIPDFYDYMRTQLTNSEIIQQSGAIVEGNSMLNFPNERISLVLENISPGYYSNLGFHAEKQGKKIDLGRYVDFIVKDLEDKISQGITPSMGYTFVGLRPTIEDILIEEHGLLRGTESNHRAIELAKQVQPNLEASDAPLQTDPIVVDGITIPRIFFEKICIFDVQCYR